MRGGRRARSGLTGLGCWSDAFRLHPHFVPADPRDVKSMKPHHIFHHFRDILQIDVVFGTEAAPLLGQVMDSIQKSQPAR